MSQPSATGKLPPPDSALPAALYSAEAERAVLGSLLVHPELVLNQAFETLSSDDFFVPAHRVLFDLLRSMDARHQAIDVLTVHQNLVDSNLAAQVGSPAILAELATSFSSHLNIGTYIQLVKDKSLLRHLHQACCSIVQRIVDEPQPTSAVLDHAEREIFRVTNLSLTRSSVPVSIELRRALELVDSFHRRKGKLFGIPTGFYELDMLTTGWQKGDMVVLAARPGVGKTALGLTFARQAIRQRYDVEKDAWVQPGHAVGFFSLEMTNPQIMLRLLASVASESLQKIRRGELDDSALEKLRRISADAQEWPLYLDDSSGLTIHQLRAKARRMKDQYKIELLIVDYLQLLRSDSPQARENRQVEIAEISRGLKALAKELDIPVIVLAQLNRRVEEGKAEPALHHLRESGAIEQDADVVLLLHRPDSEEEVSPAEIPYTLHVAKQRNGPTDKIDIRFNALYTRFEDPLRHSG
ncbi:replicative DNA helicase [Methylacidimicrobium sp. AP8]|uniref:replicative DNA helicase n=1 Tax=Methylacidimicrobium sp. AP8 TaxID=2730359 RepID=UPI001F0045A7|nr:replicative DNA helicase [Methylacidimicrobium sp. AP8]